MELKLSDFVVNFLNMYDRGANDMICTLALSIVVVLAVTIAMVIIGRKMNGTGKDGEKADKPEIHVMGQCGGKEKRRMLVAQIISDRDGKRVYACNGNVILAIALVAFTVSTIISLIPLFLPAPQADYAYIQLPSGKNVRCEVESCKYVNRRRQMEIVSDDQTFVVDIDRVVLESVQK